MLIDYYGTTFAFFTLHKISKPHNVKENDGYNNDEYISVAQW